MYTPGNSRRAHSLLPQDTIPATSMQLNGNSTKLGALKTDQDFVLGQRPAGVVDAGVAALGDGASHSVGNTFSEPPAPKTATLAFIVKLTRANRFYLYVAAQYC